MYLNDLKVVCHWSIKHMPSSGHLTLKIEKSRDLSKVYPCTLFHIHHYVLSVMRAGEH